MGSIESFSSHNEEKELSNNEQNAVDFIKRWYTKAKQKNPDASEADIHTTVVSGLGYQLDIPGYRLGDHEIPDAKPTQEQQERLEELYGMVVGKEKNE